MPVPDPVPSLRGSTWRRFRRVMRWMSLIAILAAATSVWFVARGESELRIHMLIATALGAGLTVLLGAALMTQRRVRHLPVVEGGQLKGIVSIGDLVKHRMDRMEAEAEAMRAYIQSA